MLTQDPLEGIGGIANTGMWMVEEQENGEFKLMMFNDKPYLSEQVIAESKNKLRAKFIPADTNNDGQLTKAEYVDYSTARFERADSDGDGVLSKSEHAHSSFKKADANKDGLLTREEYSSIFELQFEDVYDKNGDGIVTAAESNNH